MGQGRLLRWGFFVLKVADAPLGNARRGGEEGATEALEEAGKVIEGQRSFGRNIMQMLKKN